MEGELAVHLRHEVARSGARLGARGQVEVGPVRQQHVLHPKRRPAARPDRADEPREALRPAAVEPRHDRRPAHVSSAAAPWRAERGRLLGGDEAVAVRAERREDRCAGASQAPARTRRPAASRRGSAARPWWSSRTSSRRCGTRWSRPPARRSSGSGRRPRRRCDRAASRRAARRARAGAHAGAGAPARRPARGAGPRRYASPRPPSGVRPERPRWPARARRRPRRRGPRAAPGGRGTSA